MTADMAMRRARVAALTQHPFFGSLVTRLKVEPTTQVQQMGTDGQRLLYNPAYVESQTEEDLLTAELHEVLHCALLHPYRRGNRNPTRWNYACDYVANQILADYGRKLPEGALLDPRFKGKSAEEVFLALDENGDEQDGKGKGGGGQGGNPGQPGSEPDPNGQDQDGQDGEGQGKGDGQKPSVGGFGWLDDSPAKEDGTAPDEEAEWKVAVVNAARAEKMQRGNVPGAFAKLVEQVTKTRIDWRTVLSEFLNHVSRNDYNWSRANRRHFGRGIILPTLHSREIRRLVVVNDTSGSTEHAQGLFCDGLSGILSAYDCHLTYVCCDAHVHSATEYTTADLPLKPELRGFGGTDFRPVFKWAEEQEDEPSAMVFFTDLEGPFPETPPQYPVLWIATTDHTPPFGEVVRLDPND